MPDTTVDFAPGKIRISKVRSQASNNNLTDSNQDLQNTLNLSNQAKTNQMPNDSEPYANNNFVRNESKTAV